MSRETLEGRHIAITGAGSGIGLATARLFTQLGAKVALLDRDTVVMEIAPTLTGAVGITMDVSSQDSVDAGIDAAATMLGTLDGLVNCAGADFSGSIDETTPTEWSRLLAVNLTGPYLVARAALPWLRKADRATIVNIASGLGFRPIRHRAAYSATKAGIIMFSKALALEVGPNIRVNAVCPGVVDTPMLRKAWPDAEGIAKVTTPYVIKTLPSAEDLAYSILFMTSDASRHITGTALASDGGSSLH
jgi:NAD(P)-dependent dehydrogenase (short-subunit alcohol dehydrogenase family)